MTKARRLPPFFLFVWIACSGFAVGEVSLPAILSDHMVLQQGKPLPVWGWADPGERVQVRIAGQVQATITGEDGRWKVLFNPMESSNEPRILIIEGKNRLVIRDILIGEVWLASGQSNMEFSLASTDTAVEETSAASFPEIRLFTTPRNSSLAPVERINGSWQTCRPDTAASFSAVAYFFGRQLHRHLRVPIGLIESSWGGTNAEEWTSGDWLRGEKSFQPILERWENTGEEIKALYGEPSPVELWLDDVRLFPKDPDAVPLVIDDYDDGDLVNLLFGAWSSTDPESLIELAVHPREIGHGKSLRFAARFRVGETPVLELKYSPARIVDLSDYKAISFLIRGKGALRLHSLQPSITDWDNYASGWMELPPDWREVVLPFHGLRQAGWGKRRPFTEDRLSGVLFEVSPVPGPIIRPPAGLFNGMIRPLVPFSIRGAIWYQGEGNAGRAEQYQELLPTMIKSWRKAWFQDDLPFLIVQLPNFRSRKAEPSESTWAELRDAHFRTAAGMLNVGLAVTIELGEADDVHPRSKKEVGRRLALFALGETYGERLVYSGPIFEAMVREEQRLRLNFLHTGSGLIAAGGLPLKGFAVAGADQKFYWANARIENDTVVVWSEQVPDPVAARYAWADNPDCNLYNREGLPAAPFRTDDWPGITAGKR